MSTIHLTVPGRVATMPERLTSGRAVGAKFRIASTERWFDRAAEAWNDAQPVYLTVTCWRQLAESVLVSLDTGDPVIVRGKLVNTGFERDGRSEVRLEVVADAIGPDLRWSTAVVTRTKAAAADAPPSGGAEEPVAVRRSDLPVAREHHREDAGHGVGVPAGEGAVRA
ncbi:MAG TPA: single-stranded DNA-binding protein [Pseudonocardia sp.]|nr:single-stranded DNA-binding protein [Pseudonocardia sp.]